MSDSRASNSRFSRVVFFLLFFFVCRFSWFMSGAQHSELAIHIRSTRPNKNNDEKYIFLRLKSNTHTQQLLTNFVFLSILCREFGQLRLGTIYWLAHAYAHASHSIAFDGEKDGRTARSSHTKSVVAQLIRFVHQSNDICLVSRTSKITWEINGLDADFAWFFHWLMVDGAAATFENWKMKTEKITSGMLSQSQPIAVSVKWQIL